MLRTLILLFFLSPYLAKACLAQSSSRQAQNKIKKKFKLPSIIEEVSGLHFTPFGKFIWLNDSGGEPELYQTDGFGKLEKTIRLQNIKNVDWEELTADDHGNLYIGDFGNNRNNRKDLKIHRYHLETQQLKTIDFSYPDQKAFPPKPARMNFDMEGYFWYDGKLHLFSKNKVGAGDYNTKHYILSDEEGQQVATLKNQLLLKDRVVTAAAISPDKKTVALLSYDYRFRKPIPYSAASLFFIRNWEGNNFLSGDVYRVKVPKFIVANQYESIDFIDNETIYIATEKVKFIKQKAKRMRLKKRFFKKVWKKKSSQ